MSPAFRSVLVVNRSSLAGTAVILALSAALLTATGAWLDAGVRGADLLLLSTVASSFAGTVLMIAVFIVAGVFAAALRPRRKEFALLRAVGATATQVRGTVTAEAVVLMLFAAPVGAAFGLLVAPLLSPLLVSTGIVPAGFSLPLSPLAFLATLAVVVPTGLIAARSAARGILRVSPTAAVRESTIDPAGISRGRRMTAAGLAVAGVLAATTPFFAPGTVGAAAGASSAILLVIAAGLAGPALVRWAALRGTALVGETTGPARVLALANARGFSRRLSAVIIPLALLVALGAVQSGDNSAVATATGNELEGGVRGDLVAVSPSGITPDEAAAIAALPGVTATTATGQVTAAVRTDAPDEDMPALDGLDWEPTAFLTITPGEPLLDPGVRSGSLEDLATAGTIAVSGDALLFTGKTLGDTVDVRFAGDTEQALTIVAVYDRGLGFGDYMIGAPPAGSAPAATPYNAVLVDGSGGPGSDTAKAIAAMGLTVTDAAGFAHASTRETGNTQQLSLILLLALLGFVAAAAANTLLASVRGRRDEFALLMRVGATRAQIMRTAAVETVFIIAAALAIGFAAVLPALLGVGQGLFGIPLPIFDVPVAIGLAASTVLIAVLTVLPATWSATRPAA